jgi:hypothetical protein
MSQVPKAERTESMIKTLIVGDVSEFITDSDTLVSRQIGFMK